MSNVTPLTVGKLKKLLDQYEDDTKIAFSQYSEYAIMEEIDITLEQGCPARPDGWIQRARPDIKSEMYLVFPGN